MSKKRQKTAAEAAVLGSSSLLADVKAMIRRIDHCSIGCSATADALPIRLQHPCVVAVAFGAVAAPAENSLPLKRGGLGWG